MHIVTFTFECGGFDFEMMRGGMSLSAWHLAREFAKRGHRSSIVTPAHGRLSYLRSRYPIEELDYRHEYELPLRFDLRIWANMPPRLEVPLYTRAFRMTLDGVEVYFLSNSLLDALPDRFYPQRSSEGRHLSWFKPLAFQVDGAIFIDKVLSAGPMIVQAYEPIYHYLLAPALAIQPGKKLVSTIASNMPINQKVFRPQAEAALRLLGLSADLGPYCGLDAAPPDPVSQTIPGQLPAVQWDQSHGPDYVGVHALVADKCDLLAFLSKGQQDHYRTFQDTPMERLFTVLPLASMLRASAHKHVVGGCGVSDEWLARDPRAVDRSAVLRGLGLSPELPTFIHSARYSPHHKGQLEMFRALDAYLSEERGANFIIRCALSAGAATGAESGNGFFAEVAARHPENIVLDWRMVDDDTLFAQTASADFCLYPSKFELDTFLISQGEAMACGAVPIATAQQGTRHYGHHAEPEQPDATGFPLARSFRDDDPVLVSALSSRIRQAAEMFRSRPEDYRRLSGNARRVARGFTWAQAAQKHLTAFELADCGGTPGISDEDALRLGWLDRLDPGASDLDPGRVQGRALTLGDEDVYRRWHGRDEDAVDVLFQGAYARADFPRCEALADRSGRDDLLALIHDRCTSQYRNGNWEVRYVFFPARRVELLTAPADPGTAMRLGRGGEFHVAVPGTERGLDAVFRLTLSGGRTAWDGVRIGPATGWTPI